MTDEGKALTEKWVASKGADYPYAYDMKGSLKRYFGVRGIPHAVLIDPNGMVAWSGHPGGLNDGTVEQALKGALAKPMFEWPASAKSTKSALIKGDLAKALEAAAKIEGDEGESIRTSIQEMVTSRVAQMKRAYEVGNYLFAAEASDRLSKALSGLPEQAEAEQVAADLDANDKVKDIIKAQKEIAKIRSKMPSKKKDIAKAIDKLKDLQREHAGSYVESETEELIKQIQASR